MLWLIVGIVLGYIFKPQIDTMLGKLVKKLRQNRDRRNYYDSDRDR